MAINIYLYKMFICIKILFVLYYNIIYVNVYVCGYAKPVYSKWHLLKVCEINYRLDIYEENNLYCTKFCIIRLYAND